MCQRVQVCLLPEIMSIQSVWWYNIDFTYIREGMFWRKYNIHVGSPYLASLEFIWLSYSIWATFWPQNIILAWVYMGVYSLTGLIKSMSCMTVWSLSLGWYGMSAEISSNKNWLNRVWLLLKIQVFLIKIFHILNTCILKSRMLNIIH